jgi:hypothetical protein
MAAEAPAGLRIAATTTSVSNTNLTSHTISYQIRYQFDLSRPARGCLTELGILLSFLPEAGETACPTFGYQRLVTRWGRRFRLPGPLKGKHPQIG